MVDYIAPTIYHNIKKKVRKNFCYCTRCLNEEHFFLHMIFVDAHLHLHTHVRICLDRIEFSVFFFELKICTYFFLSVIFCLFLDRFSMRFFHITLCNKVHNIDSILECPNRYYLY